MFIAVLSTIAKGESNPNLHGQIKNMIKYGYKNMIYMYTHNETLFSL